MDLKIIRLSDGATVKESASVTDKPAEGCVLLNPVKHAYDRTTGRLRPLSTGEQLELAFKLLEMQAKRIAALEAARK